MNWFTRPATQAQVLIVAVVVAIVVAIFGSYLIRHSHSRDNEIKHIDQGLCLAINTLDQHPAQDPPFVVQLRAEFNCATAPMPGGPK